MNKSISRFLRSLKYLLVRLIQFLPVSSETIGPPKGIIKSALTWIQKYNKVHSLYQAYFIPIHAGKSIKIKLPFTIEKTQHWKFKEKIKDSILPTFVASIPYGRVWGNVGTVITPDDYVLGEVAREFGKQVEQNSVFLQLKLASCLQIRGKVAILVTAGSEVYFHWMFDILPRIRLLQLVGKLDEADYFILGRTDLPFQRESLQLLGIHETKIIHSLNHWSFHVKADELIVPSLPSTLDAMSKWSCDFLRETFLSSNIRDERTKRRIYISRQKAPNRKVENEVEVLQVLQSLNFEVIFTEDMKVQEQANLFASADCIVAPHGAGLTNLVFCNPGTKVIDIFSPNWVNPCYWILSNEIGLDYFYLIGKGKRPPDYVDPALKGNNIMVDIEMLIMTLGLAGIN